jgi:hypothetical protein
MVFGYTGPSTYPGYVNYQSTSFNGWNINVQGQVTGDANHPNLDLLIQATSPSVLNSFNGGPLGVSLSETGFGATSGSFRADLSVTATGNAQPIWFQSYYNPSNTYYGTTTSLTSSGYVGPVVYSSSITSDPVRLNNYLLGENIAINRPLWGPGSVEAPGATYTIHATLTFIPEPSVASLAIGALAMFYSRSRISRRP